PQTTTLLSEGFENGTKTSYPTGAVTLTSGSWTLNNALIGDTAADPKTGTKSLRICNLGKATMNFNVTGPGTLAIKHARHGTDPQASWELWSSTNNGGAWTRVGVPMTAYQTSLGTASFPVNISSQVRFEIRKTTGNTDSSRLNFDDITFTRGTNSGSQAQPKGK
ncbi:MAG TPA: DNA/RNA non-specific endonuclease, partial [Acidobacteriota bacterium]|nr:DNA/RNA non-specific endonuclease [Acidobacteriota bacterium]